MARAVCLFFFAYDGRKGGTLVVLVRPVGKDAEEVSPLLVICVVWISGQLQEGTLKGKMGIYTTGANSKLTGNLSNQNYIYE